MKRFLMLGIAITATMLLAGCGTTCIEKATTIAALNGQVVNQANMAFEGDLIGIEIYEEIDRATSDAHTALNVAVKACVDNTAQAENDLSNIKKQILSTQKDVAKYIVHGKTAYDSCVANLKALKSIEHI